MTDTVDKLGVGSVFDVCFLWQRPFNLRRGLLPGRFLALGWWFFVSPWRSGWFGDGRRRFGHENGEPFEVLGGGGEQELVVSAG
jgi:hypothetical protein